MIFGFLFTLGVIFLVQNINEPNVIIREAIKKKDISDINYVLCQRARVTGFDWLVIQNEKGENSKEPCNIVGPNPFEDFDFEHEFIMAQNTFVFYIEEKNTHYSEEMGMDVIEYTAVGWDILYPIKRELFDLLASKKYIVENDLRNKRSN